MIKNFIVGILTLIMVMFVCGIVHAETVIMDNGELSTSCEGVWSESSGVNPYGSNSLWNKTIGDTYTFETTISGIYEVSLWWTEYASRNTGVPVEIYSGDTLLDTVEVNQQINGGQWNTLGVYSFTDIVRVVLVSEGNNVSTCADAVKIEQQIETVNLDMTVAWTRPDNANIWAGLWIRINGNDLTVVDITDPNPVIWQGILTLNVGENVFEMLAYDIDGQQSEWSEPAYYTPGQEILRAPTGISIRLTE